MTRRPILVTGFEPFAGASLNPSQLVVEQLGLDPRGLDLQVAVLPVEYAKAVSHLLDLVAEIQPLAVVCLGQAEGRAELSFERVAVNLNDARLADNSGELRVDQQISPEGPAAFFSTLPVKEMVEAVRAAGVPAGLSLSAGAFVCNHIFYSLQAALAKQDIPNGFVHLPLVPEQSHEFPGQATLALEQQVDGIAAALSVL